VDECEPLKLGLLFVTGVVMLPPTWRVAFWNGKSTARANASSSSSTALSSSTAAVSISSSPQFNAEALTPLVEGYGFAKKWLVAGKGKVVPGKYCLSRHPTLF
jgi:hypothetical protein